MTLPPPLIAPPAASQLTAPEPPPPLGPRDALPEDYNALLQLYGVVALRLIALQAWSVRVTGGKHEAAGSGSTRKALNNNELEASFNQ